MAKRRVQHRAWATLTLALYIDHEGRITYSSADGGTNEVPITLTQEHRDKLYQELMKRIDSAIAGAGDDTEIRVGVQDADPAVYGDKSATVTTDVGVFAKVEDVSIEHENPGKPAKAKRGKSGHAKPVRLTYKGRDGEMYTHPFGASTRLVGLKGGGVQIQGVRVVRGQIVG